MFFESTPNFLYPDFKVAGKYKLSKNLFRRVRTRDSFNAVYASSKPYTIKDGETADSLAYTFFNEGDYFWTILLLNNITNIHEEWPLDSDELDVYLTKKYGDNIDKPRHWETTEVKDNNQKVVLEAGIIVEIFTNSTQQNQSGYYPQIFNAAANGGLGQYETWSFSYLNNVSYNSENEIASSTTVTLTAAQNLKKVTNREYEYELNELKKEIYIPTANAVQIMEDEIKKLLEYDTQYKITDEGYRISESV